MIPQSNPKEPTEVVKKPRRRTSNTVSGLQSISFRLVAGSTLLILAILSAVVVVWAGHAQELIRAQKRDEARSLVDALARTSWNELQDQNTGQLRVNLDLLLQENEDFAYILLTDDRLGGQIVAAAPPEMQEQFVPDVVPLHVTEAALRPSKGSRAVETFLLRDIEWPKGTRRATRRERIMEVATDVRLSSGTRIGTLRAGISLADVDRALAEALSKALLVGLVALLAGIVGAWLVAQRIVRPLQRLQESAAKIAGGDLRHRAEVTGAGEIGALARAFNHMTASLQSSFDMLNATLMSFERFVPQKFLSVIAPEGMEKIQVGACATRHISVLFSDIRGYTSLSEGTAAIDMFHFLNDYLACMGNVINQSGGFIDKYIGDAIMALFDEEHTDGALRAALAMRKALIVFNLQRAEHGLPTIDTGIGIHSGEVVMGTVGYTSRMESTVIGDTVNVASRVEGLTKVHKSAILVTQSVISKLAHPEDFTLRLLDGSVTLKGKDEPVAIYALEEPVADTMA